MNRIVCIGESFVDLLAESEVDDIGASEYFRRAAGGAVANVAIGIARLGGSVAFVGAVGRDPFGQFLLRNLARENVDVRNVRTVEAPTPVIFVARGPQGSREFYPMNCPGADTQLDVGDLDRGLLSQADCIHFGGVTLAAQPGRSACMAAVAMCRPGAFVSFDINVRPLIFTDRADMRRVLLEACEAAHVVKCSEDDLAALGIADSDPKRFLRGATKAAIVTRGAEGCRWATADGGAGSVKAPFVDSVDTTGAGDAFMAALLWRLCAEHPANLSAVSLADAVCWAVAAGVLACTREGAVAGMPCAGDLEAALPLVRSSGR